VEAKSQRRAVSLCDLYVRYLPSLAPSLSATANHEMYAILRDEFIRTKRRIIWRGDTSEPLKIRRDRALRSMEFSWVSIGDLQRGDMVAEPFPQEEESRIPSEFRTAEGAFLLGLYAAEGCVVERYDRASGILAGVIFVISIDEKHIADRVVSSAATLNHTAFVREDPDTNSIRIELSWKSLAETCRDHIGRGAQNKFLSEELLVMPRSWQKSFFDAYSNGDGCTSEAGTIRVVSASARLLHDSRLLLARLGKTCSISGRHNKSATWYSGLPIFELSISGGQSEGRRSTSKSYLHPDGFILSAVASVRERAWSGTVYNLEVQEDNSYTANGFAVHNSNINGDYFPEAALSHEPPNWGKYSSSQHVSAGQEYSRKGGWGYTTFYGALVFKHHRNKSHHPNFGGIVLALWNPVMRRVELILRLDHGMAISMQAMDIIDRLNSGLRCDVSMGCKVPYDTCSICLDWVLYNQALDTFNPEIHATPGRAVVQFHRNVRPIRGLAITRRDYCEHAATMMNHILPDGRKVFVYNDFPRFFDLSFVLIGADRIGKTMAKLAHAAPDRATSYHFVMPVDSVLTDPQDEEEKIASVWAKAAEAKKAEIEKEINDPTYQAVNLLSRCEKSLPTETLNQMGEAGLPQALSSAASLGMLLSPQEFQRVCLVSGGKGRVADVLDQNNSIFKMGAAPDGPIGLHPLFSDPVVRQSLMPHFDDRSFFDLPLRRRVVRITIDKRLPETPQDLEEVEHEELDKVSAAYSSYRLGMLEKLATFASVSQKDPDVIGHMGRDVLLGGFGDHEKTSSLPIALLASIFPATYLVAAHLRVEQEKGKQLSSVSQFVANNPFFSSALIAGGATAVVESGVAKPLVSMTMKAITNIARKALPLLRRLFLGV